MNQKELEVLKTVEILREELVERVKELVKIPTVNPPGECYEEMANLLAKRLNEIGLEVDVINVPRDELRECGVELPRPIVVGFLKDMNKKRRSRRLVLNGHYDVVPPGSGWSVDPFQAVVKEGRVYGRGAADMKGAIASMIVALKAIKESQVTLKGGLCFTLVPDEEVGGRSGSGYVVKKRIVSGDGCVIGEASGLTSLFTAQKGLLWLEIITRGRAAHASMPHMGLNAVEKMAKIIVGLERLKSEFARYESALKFPDSARHTTINVGGVIRGGAKINMVPDFCSCTLDIRVIPEESTETVERRVREFLEGLKKEDPGLMYELRVLDKAEPAHTSVAEEVVKVGIEAVKDVIGKLPAIEGSPYSTDMRWFKEIMPTIIYGPGSVERLHAPDECVSTSELEGAAKVYSLIIMRFLGYE
jgi:succinyl-diaminopimelate desuccinylase